MDPVGSFGFTNSQMIPAAGNPANLHKSVEYGVSRRSASSLRRNGLRFEWKTQVRKKKGRVRLTDRSFRVTLPRERTLAHRTQRNEVTGPVEIPLLRRIIGQFPRGESSIVG